MKCALVFNPQWDGGYDADPSGMDVFVFDATFLDHFRDKGLLSGIGAQSVVGLDDYVPFAIKGAAHGGKYYGLPMYGCANILFYRQGDTSVESATTLSALTQALGSCTYTSEIPPDERGLLIDMAGGTTNACLYAGLVEGIAGEWPITLPTDPSRLDPTAVAAGKSLLASASFYNATNDPSNGPYGRAAWFSQGNGRAVMGYTESMSSMSAETRAKIAFRPFPLGNNTSARPLFYSDLIGISPTTTQPALALELANLMASTSVLVAGMQGNGEESPQFLMPARTSLFLALAEQDPIYARMQAMVSAANPLLFNLGPSVRDYIVKMKAPIKQAIRAGYSCGCDQDGGALGSESQAKITCPQACASYGGWNGQWTAYPPGGTTGWKGGCGCNACPAQ